MTKESEINITAIYAKLSGHFRKLSYLQHESNNISNITSPLMISLEFVLTEKL